MISLDKCNCNTKEGCWTMLVPERLLKDAEDFILNKGAGHEHATVPKKKTFGDAFKQYKKSFTEQINRKKEAINCAPFPSP